MSRLLILVVFLGLSVAFVFMPARTQSQEKGFPIKPIATARPNHETLEMYRMLNVTTNTKGLQEKVKLKTAIEYLSDQLQGKLVILVDRDAFAAVIGPDSQDPYEEEVVLPPVPSKMPMSMALRLILSQVGGGQATYIIRRTHIEVTPLPATTAAYMLRLPIPFATFDQRALPEVLGDLADENSLAINLDPTIGKKGLTPISVTFRNCSLEDALVTVTEMAELKYVVLENSVFVTTPEKAVILRKEEEKRAADRKELKLLPRRLVPAA